MDELTSNLDNLTVESNSKLTTDHTTLNINEQMLVDSKIITNTSHQHFTQTDIINLVREYFTLIEQECFCQAYIDKHVSKWKSLPDGMIQLVHKLALREKMGTNTDLEIKLTLDQLGYYSSTHFRSTDDYYISMLVDFLENIDTLADMN